MSSVAGATPRDDHELTVAVTGRTVIAGREFPAPTAAVIALLDAIRSPFVAGSGDDAAAHPAEMDVFRALYLLAEREKAALPILRMKRREAMLEKLPEPADAETAFVYVRAREVLADAEGDFDAAALKFADTLGAIDLSEASDDLCLYLTLATGFTMFPDSPDKDKKKVRSGMTSTA